MIVLYHPKDHSRASVWQSQLEQMAVTHHVVESAETTPYLREGKKEVRGIEEIDQFIEEYKAFMATWNQDRCDMWFFDEDQ